MRQSFTERLQKWLRTDVKYLYTGGTWTLLSYVIQVISGAILTIALANWLPKEVLGTYQFILAIVGILSVMTLSGIDSAITRAVAQGDEGAFLYGVRTKLKWNIIIFVFSNIFTTYYFLQGNTTLASCFFLISLCVPLLEAFKLYLPYLHGKQAFADQVLLGAWRRPLPLLALLIAIYFTDQIVIIIATYFISNTLTALLIYLQVRKKYSPPQVVQNEILTYSKHLSILTILGRIGQYGDKVIVWHFLGPVTLASYTIAQLITKYTGGIFQTVSVILLPKLANRELSTLQKSLHRKVFFFTMVVGLFTIVIIALIPFVYSYALPEYQENILLTQVLSLSLIFSGKSIYQKAIIAHKLISLQYFTSIFIPFFRLGLITTLILYHGIWGAIIGLVITEAAAGITYLLCFTLARPRSEATVDHD